MFTITKERYPFIKKAKKVLMATYRTLHISAHAAAMYDARITNELTNWIPYPVKRKYEKALTPERLEEIATLIEADLVNATRRVATREDSFLVPVNDRTYVVRIHENEFYVITTYATSMCTNKLN